MLTLALIASVLGGLGPQTRIWGSDQNPGAFAEARAQLTAEGAWEKTASRYDFAPGPRKQLDEETGLTYFGARYYDSKRGRWISPDAAALDLVAGGNPIGLSTYAYTFHNPLNLIDPDGNAPGQPFGSRRAAIEDFRAWLTRDAPAETRELAKRYEFGAYIRNMGKGEWTYTEPGTSRGENYIKPKDLGPIPDDATGSVHTHPSGGKRGGGQDKGSDTGDLGPGDRGFFKWLVGKSKEPGADAWMHSVVAEPSTKGAIFDYDADGNAVVRDRTPSHRPTKALPADKVGPNRISQTSIAAPVSVPVERVPKKEQPAGIDK